jgi:uncharacterized membrane protein
MFGSARTIQVTLKLRQMAAAILTFALVTVLAMVLAIGQITAWMPTPAPAGAPAVAPTAAPAVVVNGEDSGSGGSSHYRLPQ